MSPKPSLGDYDALLVDLDGTLYRPWPLKWLMAGELILFGTHHIPVIRTFRREHERLRAEGHAPTESPYALQIENTARALEKPPEEIEAIVTEWMQERPSKWIRRCARTDLLEELLQFKHQGGYLALVSDYPTTRKLAALKGAPTFDTIVANGEQGGPARLKPEPDGYLLAAERLGLPPERCLVLGDRDDADGEAARRAGMNFRQIG